MSVADLAKAAGLDLDETLIRLWEAGLNRYTGPSDRLRRGDMDTAFRAVGLPTGRDLVSPAYWMSRLSIDETAFLELLAELGTPMAKAARTLPKGAVKRLRAYVNSMAGDRPEQPPVALAPESVEEPFEWRTVGHERNLQLLSEEEVQAIHWELVRDFAQDADPIDPPGVRDPALLASAVFRQHTALGEQPKYPTAEMAAAALFHSIVHDHPFFNGNKRTALVSMLVLLDENGIVLECNEEDLFKLVLRLAQHKLVPPGKDLADREAVHVAEWLHSRCRNVEKGDRPIQWRRLRQILRGFDCTLSQPSVGNRMNIRRTVLERGLLGRTRQLTLFTQVKYTDDGREALVETVKKIRRDLWLDEDHGVDSLVFYQRGGPSAADFIARYRKTLKNLARL